MASQTSNFERGPYRPPNLADQENPDPYSSPYQQQHNPARSQFELAPGHNHQVHTLLLNLETGWYQVYKYLVMVMIGWDIFAVVIGDLLGQLNSTTSRPIIIPLLDILLRGWDVYQLFLIYQAMIQKDVDYARQAVKLMWAYLIALIPYLLILINVDYDPDGGTDKAEQSSGIGKFVSFLFSLALLQGWTYMLNNFGAKKVLSILEEADMMGNEDGASRTSVYG